jgi:hypothetical protein
MSRIAVLIGIVAIVAAYRAGLLARLGRATTVRSVRPGAR